MGSLSDYAEVMALVHSTGKNTWPAMTAYVALCMNSTPTDASTGATLAEPTTPNNYMRKATVASDWASPTSGAGTVDNAAAITFPTASGSWGTIGYFAICDSATPGTGNMIWWGQLTVSKTIASGDTAQFAIGDLDLTID